MPKPGGNGTTIRPSAPPAKRAREARAQGFVRGISSEIRRITWPSRREWVSATVLTLVLVIGIGVFTYAVDQLCTALFGLVHH